MDCKQEKEIRTQAISFLQYKLLTLQNRFFFFFLISNKLKNKKKTKVDHTKTYKWECTNSLEFALRVFGSTT